MKLPSHLEHCCDERVVGGGVAGKRGGVPQRAGAVLAAVLPMPGLGLLAVSGPAFLNGVVLDPVFPLPSVLIVGGLLVGALAWLGWRNARRLGRLRAGLLLVTRLLAVLMCLGFLLRPSRREILPAEKRDFVLLAGLDVSESMDQPDADGAKRLDAAVQALTGAKIDQSRVQVRTFAFDDTARAVPWSDLGKLKAEGQDSRLHSSVRSMLGSLKAKESGAALLLFTDGHDFEGVNAASTAMLARSKGVPVYPIPLGASGSVRDVAMRMTGWQSYAYVKQKCRISAMVKITGCESERLTVQLLRDGKQVQSKDLFIRQEAEMPVEFSVTEPEAGQVEYEVRAVPVYKESEVTNNSAITYLNVIDDKLRVLLLEGQPFWDTTFLERTLFRNDKVDIDAVMQYAPGKSHLIRKTPGLPDLVVPPAREDLQQYDVVLLGRGLSSIMKPEQEAALIDYVREDGGALVFVRGPCLSATSEAILDPAEWKERSWPVIASLEVQREGRSAPPFLLLDGFKPGDEPLPSLVMTHEIKEVRTLAATLVKANPGVENDKSPAVLQRPVGRGQTLAINVAGLWQWAFRHEGAAKAGLFDRFWDQMLVWLLANSEKAPGAKHRLRPNTANLQLGEEMVLRLQGQENAAPLTVTLFREDQPAGQLTMAATEKTSTMEARVVPDQVGRYRAEVTMADGSKQQARFLVHQEKREKTEVTADRAYLGKLATSSGGRVTELHELRGLVQSLQDALTPAEPKSRLISLWDRPGVLYSLIALLAMDWYFRRRWGLT